MLFKKIKDCYNEKHVDLSFTLIPMSEKLKLLNIDVDKSVINYIIICCDGNPGLSQLVMKEFLLYRKDKVQNNEKLVWDDLHGFKYTSDIYLNNHDLHDEFKEKWYAQKKKRLSNEDSDNMCDTKEWWLEVFSA